MSTAYATHGSSSENLIDEYDADKHDFWPGFLFFGEGQAHGGAATYAFTDEHFESMHFLDVGDMLYDLTNEDLEKLDSLISDVRDEFSVEKDEAYNILDGSTLFDDADQSWTQQGYHAKAAVALGYDGVWVSDEHGTSLMIDMSKHIKHLHRIK